MTTTHPRTDDPVAGAPTLTHDGSDAYNPNLAANGKRSDEYHDEYHHEEHDDIHGTSIRSQLEGWHAHRGNKSVARAIIPPWCPPKEEPPVLNPFKLVKDLTWLNWAMFLCGWFCWTCDG